MDVRDLKFPSESFDFAIDKGTMDAMMTSKGDVWVRPYRVHISRPVFFDFLGNNLVAN